MAGFWGSYTNMLDSKGRINIPAKFRKSLRKKDEETFILIRGTENCIILHPLSIWHNTMQKIKERIGNGREFRIVSRRLMYQASEQKIDKQGRLNLPANLIQYAKLEGEVLLVGYENRVEVWNPKNYQKYVEATESDYQKIAERLDF